MEPTPTPENGRQSRGLARFWPVHGMPVPVQRQSDEDPGARPPGGGGAAAQQQADDPQRTDGPPTGLPGVQQMSGPQAPQANPAGTAQGPQAPFPARQVSGPQGTVQHGSAPQGSVSQGSVPQGSGLLLPDGRPATPQSSDAQSAQGSGVQPSGGGTGDQQEGPREPAGFGPSTPHPALTSDTQMVALGSRRGLFGTPQDGEPDGEPPAPNGTQARGWTGNQPGYRVDGERPPSGQHNGDVPRHGSVPGGPVNGLPGVAPNRLPPAVSPAVGPAGSSPVRPVSPGVAAVRPVSAAGPASNGQHDNGQHDDGALGNGQHGNGQHGNGRQRSGPPATNPFGHDPLGSDPLGRHPFDAGQLGAGPTSSSAVSADVPGSGRRSTGTAAPLPVSPAPVVAPASRPVSSQPVPVVRVNTAPVDLPATELPQRDGSSEPIGDPGRVPASGRTEMSGRVAMSGRRSREDDDGYDSRSDRPTAPPRRSADPDDAPHQPQSSGRAEEQPMRPGDVEQTRITLWDDAATRQFHEEWHEVKAQFVDDPVAALTRAHDLLTEAVHELTESLLAERDDLDPLRRTSTPDTESMRMAMRGYREFLDRIMAL